jgi:trans-aconitate methyltransferase
MSQAAPGAWDVGLYERSFQHVTEYGRSIVDDWLAPKPAERVLDLGCGNGELTAHVASFGATALGIDGDAGMVARAKERYPHVRFEQADGQDFAFVNEAPFDAVFSNAALHWMTKPAQVIACVQRALRPGGRFVAEFGGGHNVATVLSSVSAARVALGFAPARSPWFYPTVAEYAALLEHGGFVVRRIDCFERPTPQDPGEDGLSRWLRMYGAALFADLDAAQRAAVEQRAAELARARLYDGERWVIDYVRLRFMAFRR